MNFELQLVAVPVSDVDRANAFYTDQAGFTADHDHQVGHDIRFVQGMQLVVADIEAARTELAGRGVDVSEVQDFPWCRFVFFSDPDGNGWAVQEIPIPG